MKKIIVLITVLFILLPVSFASDTISIPEELRPWKDWVLYDKANEMCPTSYNNGNVLHCLWPSELFIDLEKNGGIFSQKWIVHGGGDFVPLPGTYGTWPVNVTLNSKPVQVIDRNKKPCIYLKPGTHTVKGNFKWTRIPEILNISSKIGIIQLTVNKKKIDFPNFDQMGNLWLHKTNLKKYEKDKLYLNLFRLIRDTIPMEIVCHLKLTISGSSREERLNKIIPDSIPIRIESPLPVKLLPGGDVIIQARPGHFDIIIVYHFKDQIDEICPKSIVEGREIWSFEAKNHLRMVTIEGVNSVDPYKTDIPDKWKKYPAYIIKPGTKMIFKTERRGDPDPAPDQLELNRTIWLDFEGNGMTISDVITGSINRNWRLTINPPTKPGRISVDSKDQLITNYGNNQNPGIEVRKGNINISADMRYVSDIRKIPAVSWNHNFQSLKVRLNLPHGWRLFTVSGVDEIHGTWFDRWTLLDFFLILIIFMIVLKLKNRLWAVLALITMTLSFTEPQAPRLVWIHLLSSIAILQILPNLKIRRLIFLWKMISIICLISISIPFMVDQVRTGIFPQLERVERNKYLLKSAGAFKLQNSLSDSFKKSDYRHIGKGKNQISGFKDLEFIDSESLIQTGPGIPEWKWKSISMKWNGPVSKDHEIKLYLISPFINLILNFMRVFLIAIMIAGLFALQNKKDLDQA